MCTRIRSQMRLRGAHRTPQSKIIISRVCLFSSPSRSELLVAPPELFVPETPPQICSTINPRLDSLLESLEFSPQQLYSSIIPPTDFLVESFEYSSALTQESYFDIGESPVSPTIPSPAIESHLEFLGRTTGSSTSSSSTSSPDTTISLVTVNELMRTTCSRLELKSWKKQQAWSRGPLVRAIFGRGILLIRHTRTNSEWNHLISPFFDHDNAGGLLLIMYILLMFEF